MPFAINKSDHNLVLKGGYISIPRGKYIPIDEADKTHPHFVQLFRAKQIEFTDTEPTFEYEPTPIEVITAVRPVGGGMTEEEYKASLLTAPPAEPPKTTGQAIGRPQEDFKSEVEATSETASEASAETSVESVETKPKKARKSAEAPATTTNPAPTSEGESGVEGTQWS